MKNVKVIATELIPTNGRKSFYGRAKVLDDCNGRKYLLSYGQVIASVDAGGVVRRHHDGMRPATDKRPARRSKTTDCHVKSFLETFAPDVTGKEFRAMPVVRRPKLAMEV